MSLVVIKDMADISETNTRTTCTNRCQSKPELSRIYNAVYYFRKLKKEGKEWHPKSTTKFHAYCVIHRLDPIAVINGEQTLDGTIIIRPAPSGRDEKIRAQLEHFRNKRSAILSKPPWVPDKKCELSTWCEENSIDIAELIESAESIDDVIARNSNNTSITHKIRKQPIPA